MEFALSDSKKAIVSATDEVLVGCFNEVRLYILFFWSAVKDALISVSMNPETMQLERMPFSPHSLAVFFEKASRAPLVEAYIANPL